MFAYDGWELKTLKQVIINEDAVSSFEISIIKQQCKRFYVREGVENDSLK